MDAFNALPTNADRDSAKTPVPCAKKKTDIQSCLVLSDLPLGASLHADKGMFGLVVNRKHELVRI